MLKTLVAVCWLAICGPALLVGQVAQPDWVRVTGRAEWSPRDSCGEVVFRDRMWILGGWRDSFQDPPRDVWSSADGIAWRLETERAPWKHGDFPTALVFNDKMWVLGGWHGGRLAHASASNQVWSSNDGKNWDHVTAAAAWDPRMTAGGVAFKGKMWVLGGVTRYYFGNDRDLRNDVWSSSDGKTWQPATTAAPWAARAYHAAIAFNDRLWVLGGGNYLPNYRAMNDVWNSADGVHWERVTEHAAWPPRIWFAAAVHRGRMWVLGGWSNKPSRNWNDVWHSADGKTWTQLQTPTIWPRRHEHSVYVLRDALWLAGGHAAPLTNDVWRLDLPASWSGK